MNSSSATECFLDLLKNERHCDVTFVVGTVKERISCHQFPLMARSSVFETMFAERWNSKKTEAVSDIELPDVTPSIFRQFLQFMYGDVFPSEVSQVIEILYLAEKYEVPALVEKCEELLKTGMEVESAIQIYQTAGKFGLAALMKAAGDHMAKQFRKLIAHPTFTQLMDEDTLVHLVARDDLAVGELQLFQALLRWSCDGLEDEDATGEDHKCTLEKILPLVRFPLMTSQDFAMYVVPTNILSTAETVAIFRYMNSVASARIPLRATLGFPWKPRIPLGKSYTVDFYEPRSAYRNLTPDLFTPVQDQIETIKFCIKWTKQYRPIVARSFEESPPELAHPLYSHCSGFLPFRRHCDNIDLHRGLQSSSSKSDNSMGASLSSVLLRGPDYSSSRSGYYGNPLDIPMNHSWRVSLKLEKWPSALSMSSCSCSPSEIGTVLTEQENIELFGDQDTEVTIDPPIVLEPEQHYQISVSFHSSVYLPYSWELSRSQDFNTASQLKPVCKATNFDDLSDLVLYLCDSNFPRRDYGCCRAHRKSYSHCIRSVKVNVYPL